MSGSMVAEIRAEGAADHPRVYEGDPPYQGRGVGSALIRAGLERCPSKGWSSVFLVGNPLYYSRFGFEMVHPAFSQPAVGALGVASPSRFVAVVRRFQTRRSLFVAAALRVVLGVALFSSAPGSRAPQLMGAVGVVIVIGGVVTPFFGVQRLRRLLDEWSAQPVLIRGWAALALALGLSLVYAIPPALPARLW